MKVVRVHEYESDPSLTELDARARTAPAGHDFLRGRAVLVP